MKRTVTILLSALLLLIVSACDNRNSTNNTISVAELTDRENAILSSSSQQSFVYDFTTDKEYKEVTVWIEKYESGKLVGDRIGELRTQVEGEGSIILTTSNNSNESQLTFNISVGDKEGVSSISANDGNSIDLDGMSSVWGNLRGDNTSIKDEMVLGSICYTNAQTMNSLTTEFYEDVNSHINELENYEVVYLLKADFNK